MFSYSFLFNKSRESILDVQNLMRATQPDIVFVEFCKTRVIEKRGLLTDEEIDKELGTFEKFLDEFIDRKHPEKKLEDFGWFQKWSLKRQARKEIADVKRSRNNEFRAAMEMATKVRGCAGLVLGELPYAHVEAGEIFNSKSVLDKNEFEKEVNEKVAGKRDRYIFF